MILTQEAKDRAIRALQRDLEMVLSYRDDVAPSIPDSLRANIAAVQALQPGDHLEDDSNLEIVVDIYSSI